MRKRAWSGDEASNLVEYWFSSFLLDSIRLSRLIETVGGLQNDSWISSCVNESFPSRSISHENLLRSLTFCLLLICFAAAFMTTTRYVYTNFRHVCSHRHCLNWFFSFLIIPACCSLRAPAIPTRWNNKRALEKSYANSSNFIMFVFITLIVFSHSGARYGRRYYYSSFGADWEDASEKINGSTVGEMGDDKSNFKWRIFP